MQLRYQTASPFCRKALTAIRLRRDRVDLEEQVMTRDRRVALAAEPMLLTDEGAFTSAADIVSHLERQRRQLIPESLAVAVLDMDRMLDLYLVEPTLTMAAEPGSRASVSAVYTTLRALDLIEDRLSDGRRWLLGGDLTLADVTAVLGATDARRHGVVLPEAIDRYVRRACLIAPIGESVQEADALFAMFAGLDNIERPRLVA